MTKAEMLDELRRLGCPDGGCKARWCQCFDDVPPSHRGRERRTVRLLRAIVEALPEGDDGR